MGIYHIPKEEWINPGKEYTCNGKKVIGLRIEMFSEGSNREVTFPVMGTVIMEGRAKLAFNRWTLNGKYSICSDDNMYDLVEVR